LAAPERAGLFREREVLPVLRDRVLEPPLALPPELREVVLRDVLLLRDPGGEDVRVAMLTTLDHQSHQQHVSQTRVGRRLPDVSAGKPALRLR
jgi:hypothetical protein